MLKTIQNTSVLKDFLSKRMLSFNCKSTLAGKGSQIQLRLSMLLGSACNVTKCPENSCGRKNALHPAMGGTEFVAGRGWKKPAGNCVCSVL